MSRLQNVPPLLDYQTLSAPLSYPSNPSGSLLIPKADVSSSSSCGTIGSGPVQVVSGLHHHHHHGIPTPSSSLAAVVGPAAAVFGRNPSSSLLDHQIQHTDSGISSPGSEKYESNLSSMRPAIIVSSMQ